MYDIISEDSFNNTETWTNEARVKVCINLQIILIGNKADLYKDRKISLEQGIEKAKD